MPNLPRVSNQRKPAPLCLDRLALHDEFIEHQDSCTFFCDAITAMLSNSAEFERGTLEGLNEFADRLKQGGNELKERFRSVSERCRAGQ